MEWKEIAGFPGYEVSNLGQVRSWRSTGYMGHRLSQPKLVTAIRDTQGYFMVRMQLDGRRTARRVHRLVALAFLGGPPTPRHVVAHGPEGQSVNTVDNLRWATQKENIHDRFRDGTLRRAQ